jgi:hypothetical protein
LPDISWNAALRIEAAQAMKAGAAVPGGALPDGYSVTLI